MKKPDSIKLIKSNKGRNCATFDIIEELKNERNYKKDTDHLIVDKIVSEIMIAIKYYNGYGKTECIQEIPMIILGFPLFNVHEVTMKVLDKMKKMKFKANYMTDNKLFISWK
jgi:hypothetical protein